MMDMLMSGTSIYYLKDTSMVNVSKALLAL